jgi:hypothetical protein
MAAIYEIGPGKPHETLIDFHCFVGFNSLNPGDTVQIYPNENHAPYPVPDEPAGLHITSSGTADAPITVMGVLDVNGNRLRLVGRGAQCVVSVAGSHVVVENIIADGGLYDMIDFLNGNADEHNRFGVRVLPAFEGETVMYDNFASFLWRKSPLFADATFESPATARHDGTLRGFMVMHGHKHTPKSGERVHRRDSKWSSRAFVHSAGDNVTFRNCVGIGSGTGLASADIGPGSCTVDGCEFGYNGMTMSAHNVYFNGDNFLYPDLTVTFKNNFVHHSLLSQGFRTRVARTVLQNNFFLDNDAKHCDLVSFDAGRCRGGIWREPPPFHQVLARHWTTHHDAENRPALLNSRFALRRSADVVGNLFVSTENAVCADFVHIGGAGQEFEDSAGRYRFVNNTFAYFGEGWFLHEGPNCAIGARFGIESVEMYNNIFYAKHPRHFTAFIDMLSHPELRDMARRLEAPFCHTVPDDEYPNQWAFGARQVEGACNWVTEGLVDAIFPRDVRGFINPYFNCVPTEWENTVVGEPDEVPFNDIDNWDYRLNKNSTAAAIEGVPVGTTEDFMNEAAFTALRDAGKLPLFLDWDCAAEPERREPVEGRRFTPEVPTLYAPAWWHDERFENPITINDGAPEVFGVAHGRGDDSDMPAVGAFGVIH